MELTNQFINKKIFSSVESLIILLPFQVGTPDISRGKVLTDQLETLLQMFQKNPGRMVGSIIPIVTKVNPKDDSFQFDSFRDNIAKIIEVNLENTLRNLNDSGLKDVAEITQEEIEQFERNERIHTIAYEKRMKIKEYCERKKFFY